MDLTLLEEVAERVVSVLETHLYQWVGMWQTLEADYGEHLP